MIFIASLALNGFNFQMPRVQFMSKAKQVLICCFFSL